MKYLTTLTKEQTFNASPIAVKTFNLVFSRKTWAILFTLAAFGSFYLNYRLLKAGYVVSCGVNGKTVAHLVSKETCNDLSVAQFDAAELYRLHTVQAFGLEN